MYCKKHGESKSYNAKGRSPRCLKCSSDSVTKRRRKLKVMAVNLLGGKCNRCGYDKCIAAFDFHHTDPQQKDFSISVSGTTRSWDRIKTEIQKCELLCSNCHREHHVNN